MLFFDENALFMTTGYWSLWYDLESQILRQDTAPVSGIGVGLGGHDLNSAVQMSAEEAELIMNDIYINISQDGCARIDIQEFLISLRTPGGERHGMYRSHDLVQIEKIEPVGDETAAMALARQIEPDVSGGLFTVEEVADAITALATKIDKDDPDVVDFNTAWVATYDDMVSNDE